MLCIDLKRECIHIDPRPYIQYLQSKKAILAICNDAKIYLFDMKSEIWRDLGLYLGVISMGYAAIVTSDDRYLIIIKDKIQVIDLNTFEIGMSDIKSPGSSTYWFYAASYHDHFDELLINGFVNEIMKNILIPIDVIDIIIRHYNTEWIYVFQQHDSLAPKWRILADIIILSCKWRT